MHEHGFSDFCRAPGCVVCDLFRRPGEDRTTWAGRVRAQWDAAPLHLPKEDAVMTYEVVDASPAEASSKPAEASVSLPSIREAGTWSRATDKLLAALEQEEREAVAAFEAARERARSARQAASAMRQLRRLVTVGDVPPAKQLPAPAAAPTDRTPPAAGARWARDYACCRECGRTEVKHAARGLCFSCYSRASKSVQGQPA